MMIWLIIIIVIFILLTLASFIDRKRKKNNNDPYLSSDPNAKPGEDTNYMIGDNRYTNGGE